MAGFTKNDGDSDKLNKIFDHAEEKFVNKMKELLPSLIKEVDNVGEQVQAAEEEAGEKIKKGGEQLKNDVDESGGNIATAGEKAGGKIEESGNQFKKRIEKSKRKIKKAEEDAGKEIKKGSEQYEKDVNEAAKKIVAANKRLDKSKYIIKIPGSNPYNFKGRKNFDLGIRDTLESFFNDVHESVRSVTYSQMSTPSYRSLKAAGMKDLAKGQEGAVTVKLNKILKKNPELENVKGNLRNFLSIWEETNSFINETRKAVTSSPMPSSLSDSDAIRERAKLYLQIEQAYTFLAKHIKENGSSFGFKADDSTSLFYGEYQEIAKYVTSHDKGGIARYGKAARNYENYRQNQEKQILYPIIEIVDKYYKTGTFDYEKFNAIVAANPRITKKMVLARDTEKIEERREQEFLDKYARVNKQTAVRKLHNESITDKEWIGYYSSAIAQGHKPSAEEFNNFRGITGNSENYKNYYETFIKNYEKKKREILEEQKPIDNQKVETAESAESKPSAPKKKYKSLIRKAKLSYFTPEEYSAEFVDSKGNTNHSKKGSNYVHLIDDVGKLSLEGKLQSKKAITTVNNFFAAIGDQFDDLGYTAGIQSLRDSILNNVENGILSGKATALNERGEEFDTGAYQWGVEQTEDGAWRFTLDLAKDEFAEAVYKEDLELSNKNSLAKKENETSPENKGLSEEKKSKILSVDVDSLDDEQLRKRIKTAEDAISSEKRTASEWEQVLPRMKEVLEERERLEAEKKKLEEEQASGSESEKKQDSEPKTDQDPAPEPEPEPKPEPEPEPKPKKASDSEPESEQKPEVDNNDVEEAADNIIDNNDEVVESNEKLEKSYKKVEEAAEQAMDSQEQMSDETTPVEPNVTPDSTLPPADKIVSDNQSIEESNNEATESYKNLEQAAIEAANAQTQSQENPLPSHDSKKTDGEPKPEPKPEPKSRILSANIEELTTEQLRKRIKTAEDAIATEKKTASEWEQVLPKMKEALEERERIEAEKKAAEMAELEAERKRLEEDRKRRIAETREELKESGLEDKPGYNAIRQVGNLEDDDNMSAVYKTGEAQTQTHTWKFDEDGNLVESVAPAVTDFKKLVNLLKQSDETLARLKYERELAISQYGDSYDTTSIDDRIADQNAYIDLLEKELKLYEEDSRYLREITSLNEERLANLIDIENKYGNKRSIDTAKNEAAIRTSALNDEILDQDIISRSDKITAFKKELIDSYKITNDVARDIDSLSASLNNISTPKELTLWDKLFKNLKEHLKELPAQSEAASKRFDRDWNKRLKEIEANNKSVYRSKDKVTADSINASLGIGDTTGKFWTSPDYAVGDTWVGALTGLADSEAKAAIDNAKKIVDEVEKAQSELNNLFSKQETNNDPHAFDNQIAVQLEVLKEKEIAANNAINHLRKLSAEGVLSKNEIDEVVDYLDKAKGGDSQSKAKLRDSEHQKDLRDEKVLVEELKQAYKNLQVQLVKLSKNTKGKDLTIFNNLKKDADEAQDEVDRLIDKCKEAGIDISGIDTPFGDISKSARDVGNEMIVASEKSIDDFTDRLKKLGFESEDAKTELEELKSILVALVSTGSHFSTTDDVTSYLSKLRDFSESFPEKFKELEQKARQNYINIRSKENIDSLKFYTSNSSPVVFEKAKAALEKLNNEFINGRKSAKQYDDEVRNIIKIYKSIVNVTKDADIAKQSIVDYANVVSNGTAVLDKWDKNGSHAIATFKDQHGQLVKLIFDWDQYTGLLRVSGEQTKKTASGIASFIDTLKGKWGAMVRYFLSFGGVYEIMNRVREGITIIHELDDALTEMQKVSSNSLSVLRAYQEESFDLANAVGTTAVQIQNSTADWMRLGEALEDAKESAADANILLNVSEFESIDEATESLVSMSQAYKELGKDEIIDVLNELGNNYAISTDGLATALKDSASALKTAGNDFYESAALVTAAELHWRKSMETYFYRTHLIARAA